MEEEDVRELQDFALFQHIDVPDQVRHRTDEIFSLIRQRIADYKDHVDFEYTPTTREWKCQSAHRHLQAVAQEAVRTVLNLAANATAASYLDEAAAAVVGITDSLMQDVDEDVDALRSHVMEECGKLRANLQMRAEQMRQLLRVSRPSGDASQCNRTVSMSSRSKRTPKRSAGGKSAEEQVAAAEPNDWPVNGTRAFMCHSYLSALQKLTWLAHFQSLEKCSKSACWLLRIHADVRRWCEWSQWSSQLQPVQNSMELVLEKSRLR
eukprot:gnl/TRDRNA2_/TRDRNA2_169502_c1_seq2.p1 gnl/TRDRNA2_/TRDRNA2_169502_c1~~gnl/TRDRNA2_/TRDRNA2_169502_c1_seq2.p1  ORF type:complete len:307 (+),score=49.95 gnl/TRDRNA2_/TRDRNA2_169502_c1_seq2:128-922(+)